MVHYLPVDQSVVGHLVAFHAAEAAVFHTVVELVLQQGTLQMSTQPLNGTSNVLTAETKEISIGWTF